MLRSIVDKVRSWLSKMGLIKDIKTIDQVVDIPVDDEHYKLIEQWKSIYAGYLKEWHDVKTNTIAKGEKTRRMKSMRMAKVVCEYLAKLIFNEKVQLNMSGSLSENIEGVLKDNRFYKVFQNELEKMFALGGLTIKGYLGSNYLGDDVIKISYVTPDCFIPLSYENGEVTEGIFINVSRKRKKVYTHLEIHEWVKVKEEGSDELVNGYRIKNLLFEQDQEQQVSDNVLGKQVALNVLYDDLEEEVTIVNINQPLFVYIKPNIANNIDIGSPLGISIFANSLDTLYSLDVAFDSFNREFILGRKRIIVPSSAVRVVVDPQTGNTHRYFDANDEAYEAFNLDEKEGNKIIDNSVSLRVTEHTSAINSLLNMLAMQLGFSAGTFIFDGVSVKTATEVISQRSQTFETKQSHENVIEEGLLKVVGMIVELGKLYDIFKSTSDSGKLEVDFEWDDSIIKDKDADADFYIKLKNNNLIPSRYALMQILKLTKEQANEMLEEVAKERETRTPNIEDMLGMDESLFGLGTPKDKEDKINNTEKEANEEVKVNE